MAFSGALTLTDLNDFITPSQACIKPVERVNNPVDQVEPGAASTQIHIDSGGSYYEIGTDALTSVNAKSVAPRKLEQAQINLNDCLACSGCITSAESVLITLQSHTEVLSFLSSNPPPATPGRKIPVLSIAPQSLASLAAAVSARARSSTSSVNVSPRQVLRRVRAFCTQALGFERVYDTTFARHVALLEHAREFFERKRGCGEGQSLPMPMLASACPGWVCYAEKTHAEMLPFVARTKSPQQVMGVLVKEWMGRRWGKTPDEIYHVTVMPCYDKKLEASRQDFYNDAYRTRDVDCVLTTGELELLMREKNWDLSAPVDGELDWDDLAEEIPEMLVHSGSSSGSYLHSLVDAITRGSPVHVADALPSAEGSSSNSVRGTNGVNEADVHDGFTIETRTMRNADYEELILTRTSMSVDGQPKTETVFRGAKCYGFRNLQNIVRKVGRDAGVATTRGAAGRAVPLRGRRGKAGTGGEEPKDKDKEGYDYVEVMACPSGCVNGGGQLRPVKETDEEGYERTWAGEGATEGVQSQGYAAKWGDREWTKKVEGIYWSSSHDAGGKATFEAERTARADADALAVRMLAEMCEPVDRNGLVQEGWQFSMDEKAEERRRSLFRTQYRAVESEVIGLAVKW